MALTYEQFMAKTNAEKVAGQLIVGPLGGRIIAGTYKNEVFTLTEEGRKFLAAMDAPQADDVDFVETVAEEKPKRGRRKKEAPVEEATVDEELASLLADEE